MPPYPELFLCDMRNIIRVFWSDTIGLGGQNAKRRDKAGQNVFKDLIAEQVRRCNQIRKFLLRAVQ